jgi:hypothetical protein
MRTDVWGDSYLHYKQTLKVFHSRQNSDIHIPANTIQQVQLSAY